MQEKELEREKKWGHEVEVSEIGGKREDAKGKEDRHDQRAGVRQRQGSESPRNPENGPPSVQPPSITPT